MSDCSVLADTKYVCHGGSQTLAVCVGEDFSQGFSDVSDQTLLL